MVDPVRWVGGLLGAIEDEIAHRHRPEGAERLALGDGRRVYRYAGAGHLYEFRVLARTRVPGLLGGDLRYDRGRSAPVTVESWPELQVLRLVSEEDLGEQVSGAELRYHDDRVLRVVAQRIQDVRIALIDQIDALFGPETGDPDTLPQLIAPSLASLAHLNDVQRQAVGLALRSRVCRVWGPPGTGKTRTAGALAAEWIRADRRVVLSGPTNRATDHLLLTVLEHLGWERGRVEGRIVRLGEISSDELRARWGEIVGVQALVDRRRAIAQADLEPAVEKVEELHRRITALSAGEAREEAEHELLFAIRRVRELQMLAESTPAGVVDQAQVVATTAHRVAVGQVRAVDALVLDEASMVSLPVGVLASMRARQVALVGDPRQLAPVVQSRSRRARRWLGVSIFEAGDPGSSAPVVNGPSILLDEQHRMPARVCRLVSEMTYQGELRTAESRLQQDGDGREALPDSLVLAYLNTAGRLRAKREGSESRYANGAQARLVMDAIRGMLESRPQLRGETAIIAPYRAHVRALRAAARRLGIHHDLDITTVHRIQGHERELVVLSIPECAGQPLGPFFRAMAPSDEGGRLLTVAASRASRGLLVVGDLTWLAQAAPTQGVLMHFLRLLKELGEPWLTHVERPCPLENELPNPRNTLGDLHEKGSRRAARRSGWKGSRHRRPM